jgi:hypothetical protein
VIKKFENFFSIKFYVKSVKIMSEIKVKKFMGILVCEIVSPVISLGQRWQQVYEELKMTCSPGGM